MKYHIDEKNTKPAYLQLYEQLRSDIVGGILPYGGKLPSKRILAEETGVSVITVQHSYAILCDEGYVESRQRSGYYVIYKESDFISAPDTAAAASLTHCNDLTSILTYISNMIRGMLSFKNKPKRNVVSKI